MPRNSTTGAWSYAASSTNPAISNTVISETDFNAMMADTASGLAHAPATTRVLYPTLGQVQDGAALWGGTAGGTADARAITLTPAITAYTAGQRFAFINGAAANTGATTLNVSSVGALAIRKGDGSVALAAGDLPASALITVQHDGSVFRLISATYTAAQAAAALGATAVGTAVLTAADPAAGRSAISAAGLAANTFTGAQTIGGAVTVTAGGVDIQAGGLTVDGGATVQTGNLTVDVGNVTVTSGTLSVGGNITVAGGRVVIIDRAYASYATSAALTAIIPFDDTIPQVGEGTQVLSVAITPKTTSNRVRVTVQMAGALSTTDQWGAAVFRNGAANAIAATAVQAPVDHVAPCVIQFEDVPGSTSAQTYTVRVGPSGGTLRLNGISSARRLGGVMAATIILEEMTP